MNNWLCNEAPSMTLPCGCASDLDAACHDVLSSPADVNDTWLPTSLYRYTPEMPQRETVPFNGTSIRSNNSDCNRISNNKRTN